MSVHLAGEGILHTFWLLCHMPVNMCIWICVCIYMCVSRVYPSISENGLSVCMQSWADKYWCSGRWGVGILSDDLFSTCRVPALRRIDIVVAPIYCLKDAPSCSLSSLAPVAVSRSRCGRALVSPAPPQHLLSVVFLWMTVVSGGRWYLIMISMCNFLLINDMEPVSCSSQTSKQTKTLLCLKVSSWDCLLKVPFVSVCSLIIHPKALFQERCPYSPTLQNLWIWSALKLLFLSCCY